jgi:TFIIF-interacting CTD phosphatase-like protein
MSRLYELHVYTMGRKCYAEAILDKIDPCRTLFQGRILTRDSNGSISRKRLDRIFPTDTSTVLVLDDCAEVWNDCPNLIHIKPYEYFMGVDEVNGIPSYNSQRYSSAKQNFLRLNHSALSLSFLKENEEYEENDNGDNAIMHLSDAESSDEDPSSLETMQDFSTPENVHFGSFGAYEGDDGFSVQSSPLKKDQENNDSFDSYFAKYFDLVIDNTIPKHPENDDILDNTRMVC